MTLVICFLASQSHLIGIYLILPKRGPALEDINSAVCLCDPIEPHSNSGV